MLLPHTAHSTALNNKQPPVCKKNKAKHNWAGLREEGAFSELLCVCALWGEGSMIIVCSALDVPRTNCNSFVSLCSHELHGRREQFVSVCKEISVTQTMKKKLATIQSIRTSVICSFLRSRNVCVLFTKNPLQ